MEKNSLTLKTFDGSLINNKFAFKFLGTNALRIGNIIIFPSEKFDNGLQEFDNVLNICWEIPDISSIANVLFKKVFVVNICNILSKHGETDLCIDINDNIVERGYDNSQGVIMPFERQKSFHCLNMCGNTAMGFITLIDRDESLSKDIKDALYNVLDNSFMESFK
jgi:hypothetical protein